QTQTPHTTHTTQTQTCTLLAHVQKHIFSRSLTYTLTHLSLAPNLSLSGSYTQNCCLSVRERDTETHTHTQLRERDIRLKSNLRLSDSALTVSPSALHC